MEILHTYILGVFSLLLLNLATSSNILGIFPNPTASHQLVYQTLMRELVKKGHKVTVISPSPLNESPENYTDVDISVSTENFKQFNDPTKLEKERLDHILSSLEDYSFQQCESLFSATQVQTFMRSDNFSFDLVIVETLSSPCVNGLIHAVGSPPYIAILSFAAPPYLLSLMGSPYNPSYMLHFAMTSSHHMTLWERLYCVLTYITIEKMYSGIQQSNELVQRKNFGDIPPSLYESDYNYSFLLQHYHWTLGYPEPLLPNVIQMRGLHLQQKTNPLPQEIKDFMDGATHGVIYCSLGSLFNTEDLTDEQADIMLSTFSELPQRVLLKWDGDTIPRKSDNVLISKWFPQQDILARKKVKLFIMQGGVQSLQEAIFHGVPVLGIPFMIEQKHNIHNMKLLGVCKKVVLRETSKEELLQAINELIHDKRYKDNMLSLSRRYKDNPQDSAENTVYWLEYAIRHRGAHHLRSPALDLHWTQYFLLDVLLVSSSVLFFSVALIVVIIRKCV